MKRIKKLENDNKKDRNVPFYYDHNKKVININIYNGAYIKVKKLF
jgi:hypothetical protein